MKKISYLKLQKKYSGQVVALNKKEDRVMAAGKRFPQLFKKLEKRGWVFWTNNCLIGEVLTVLLQRLKSVKQVTAVGRELYSPSKYIKVLQISKRLQQKSLEIFSKQEKPRLSFPDCTLIVQAIDQKIKTIFTFDKNVRNCQFFKKGCKFLP